MIFAAPFGGGNFFFSTNRFHQRGIGDLFAVSEDIHIIHAVRTFRVTPENDGRILLIQLHRAADPPQLLTGHKRGARAAEGVQHNGVLLGAVADRVPQQVQWFGCGMILIPLRLVVVPDGGLLSI